MQLTEVQPSHGALTDVPGDDLRLPPHSGTDRRVVYSKTIMRVWLVDADGSILHTHRVSGRLSQPRTGTYTVFSRSPVTCNRYSTNVCMRYMVRFAIGRGGDNIGFHEIPRRSGVPVMSEADLGGAVSSGCVRQATNDAQLMWAWAQVGTVVVVTP
jgi:lipoprotein-anchoring transpeptidase ErfK/SrfK